MPQLSFACPHCQHTLRADAQYAGRNTRCLQCGQPLQIPRAPAAMQPAAPAPVPVSASNGGGYGLDPLVDDLPASPPVASRPKAPQLPTPKPKQKKKQREADGFSQREVALFGGMACLGVVTLVVVVWTVWRTAAGGAAGVLASVPLPNLMGPAGPPVAGAAGAAGGGDPVFAEALANAEPGEGPYLEAARPMLTALTRRDYAGFYGFLSSYAKSEAEAGQFMPLDGPAADERIAPLSLEAFSAWMAKMEGALGLPKSVDNVYVQSIDPQVLAGKGDRLDVMFSIGGMRADIPASIRKASIRTAIQCELTPALAAEAAAARKISVQELLEELKESGEGPYFNLKFVLVEEAGVLKIGYFEFMPPSIFD